MRHGDDTGGPEKGASEISTGTRLLPRVTIQAFCEHSRTAELIETMVHDRRMSRVALTVHNGGLQAAIETYKSNPTPNLIIIEAAQSAGELIEGITRLAEVCDAGTRLIVLGEVNDVVLYRDLIRFGVSEYLVTPLDIKALVNAVSDLFVIESAQPIGRVIGFIGAKGGVGSSSVAHNVAWAIASEIRQDVLLLDMDLAFGTAGLAFNQDPVHGLADAVFANEKMDSVLLDRMMSKAANHINLMTAPGTLDRTYDLGDRQFEQVIELSQQTVPIVVLDIPHSWTGWIRHTIGMIDEIVIVAEPDLANLRNAKTLADTIRSLRPGESGPHLVLNRSAIQKRSEIPAAEFANSIECRLAGQIAFDPATFGTAANNGQMIAEVAKNHRAVEIFRAIGLEVTGRALGMEQEKRSAFLPGLPKFLKRA